MNTAIIVAMISALGLIVVQVLTLFKTGKVEARVTEIKVSIDGRMTELLGLKDELLALTKDSSYKRGVSDQKNMKNSATAKDKE